MWFIGMLSLAPTVEVYSIDQPTGQRVAGARGTGAMHDIRSLGIESRNTASQAKRPQISRRVRRVTG